MSKVAVLLALASCSILTAQQKPKQSADRVVVEPVTQPAPRLIGNEKTVGAFIGNNVFRTAQDRLIIGNAKTVGGDQEAVPAPETSETGAIGNAKTVGGH
jgi:hypothetical protein